MWVASGPQICQFTHLEQGSAPCSLHQTWPTVILCKTVKLWGFFFTSFFFLVNIWLKGKGFFDQFIHFKCMWIKRFRTKPRQFAYTVYGCVYIVATELSTLCLENPVWVLWPMPLILLLRSHWQADLYWVNSMSVSQGYKMRPCFQTKQNAQQSYLQGNK